LGIAMEEVEDLVEVLRGIEVCECACICKEQPLERGEAGPTATGDGQAETDESGRWKVSLRSKGSVDVGRIALAFGGGGHTAAGGFTAGGSLQDVIGAVVGRLAAHPSLVGA
jgi:nanoRNase/pAp phosphatase (c-di-AMP/oligoRNAs hydrolase)